MDTISRENNSMLPAGALVVSVLALLLGGYSAITVSKTKSSIKEQEARVDQAIALAPRVESVTAQAAKTERFVQGLEAETKRAFGEVGPIIGALQTSVTKLEDAAKKPVAAPAAASKSSQPAVAGPNEYIVKSGDSGMKIAAANGVSIGDLTAVNPGVNWNRIAPGQKLKLPAK